VDKEVLKGEIIRIGKQELTNPIREVKAKDEVLKYLDKEIIVETLRTITDSRDHMFLSFLWMTGCRVTEAISIEKQHIDFERNELKILWQKRKKYKYRTLAVPPQLINLLRMYTASMKYDTKLFDFTRQNADLIIKKWFGDDVSCHMIRHSYAINYLRQSASPKDLLVLQRLLGHANVQTTMKYLQIVPNDMHEGLKKINFY
jgi:integrase